MSRKITNIRHAVSLVKNNDVLVSSGFVAQGCPESLLRGLGEHFAETKSPKDITLLFGGGPGDFQDKGLNHLAKPGLLKMAIGAHYGQIPQVAKMVLNNEIAGYSLPLGAISRMIRATASKTPRFFSRVGLGTFVDPRWGGGKINQKAKESGIDLVGLDMIDMIEYLVYRPLPVRVAFIKASASDQHGNLTMNRESMLGDSKIIAMASKSSGGLVIAQVEKIINQDSTHQPRDVHIPGIMVDYVVECKEDGQSFFCMYDPCRSGELKSSNDSSKNNSDNNKFELDARTIIARRAALELTNNAVVNLGIGMPEGVAKVCEMENVSQQVTLTTEAGLIGGVPLGGKNFGPSLHFDAMIEMNEQFDFYNGGGLNCCFLGAGEVDRNGNVNVSKLSEATLTGPGGFMDISQCTNKVIFMGTFMKKNLKIKTNQNNTLQIEKEGEVGMFKRFGELKQITFNGKRASFSGQEVKYITERAVFFLTPHGLRLAEVAPGIDVKKQVLDLIPFPVIIEGNVKFMDGAIFDGENPASLRLKQSKQFNGKNNTQNEAMWLEMDENAVQVIKAPSFNNKEKKEEGGEDEASFLFFDLRTWDGEKSSEENDRCLLLLLDKISSIILKTLHAKVIIKASPLLWDAIQTNATMQSYFNKRKDHVMLYEPFNCLSTLHTPAQEHSVQALLQAFWLDYVGNNGTNNNTGFLYRSDLRKKIQTDFNVLLDLEDFGKIFNGEMFLTKELFNVQLLNHLKDYVVHRKIFNINQ